MHLIRHDLYVKLLRDDVEWKKLIAEQRAEAFKLANEAAAAREQSLTQELTSSKAYVERLSQDLDASLADNDRLQNSQDLQIRTTALTHAVHLATTGATVHVPTEARAMENFLRGQASVEGEAALINSGWNSAIEYLLQGETEGSLDASYIASLRR